MVTPIEGTNRGRSDAGAAATDQRAAPASLRPLWRRWVEIVECYAGVGTLPGRPDPREYDRVYRGLLATCRVLSHTAGDRQRDVYQRVTALVTPWLSLAVLEQSDAEIRKDLLRCCRQLDRQVGGRRWRFAAPRGTRLLLPFLVIATLAFLGVWLAEWFDLPWLATCRGWILSIRWLVTRPDNFAWVFGIGCLAVFLGGCLVWRAAR